MSEEKYHEGDLVEAVKGETVIRGRVELSPEYKRTMLALPAFSPQGTPYLSSYVDHGYTVTVIEKAKPPLPIEPGVYATSRKGGFNPYYLSPQGIWHELMSNGTLVVTKDDAQEFAPFTRLESVAETAERFRDRLLTELETNLATINTIVATVAAEFGATK